MAELALPAALRTRTLARGLTTRAGLAGIVAVSFALRAVAAAGHATPRYFPDEYIYTALARSLGESGRPLVRGEAASFPALLEPILAAPLWALFDPELAYRLVQVQNSLAMSLAAVPAFLLARRLGLGSRYALACAAFAVALPDLVYSSYTLADPIAYPLVLAAVAAGVAAIDGRTRRAQLALVAFAGLAAFARVQYVVLPVAFVAAAVAVERREVLRAQRLPLLLFATPVAVAVVLGPSRLLGYYAGVSDLGVGLDVGRWALTDLFLLALVAGVVLVPGAVVGLLRARGRREVGFATLTVALAAMLLLEAGLYAADGSNRFQERYLFALLPLVPLAFGLYLKHGRPWPRVIALISAALFLAAARLPLSGYSAAAGKTDSPFLVAVFRLERLVGEATGSLVVASLVAAGAAGAVVVAYRGGARRALAATLCALALTSAAATRADLANTSEIRSGLPAVLPWVDAHGFQDVTVVQTPASPRDPLLEHLFWNESLTREVVIGGALPTDAFAAPRVRIGADGSLERLRGPLLVHEFGTTVVLDDAELLERAGPLSLWRPRSSPRLALLAVGRFWDGWLARRGEIDVWPGADGRTRGTLSVALSLPAGHKTVEIRVGKIRYRIEPGMRTTLRYRIDKRGPWTIRFRAAAGSYLDDLRAVSVVASKPVFVREGERSPVARAIA